MQQELKTARKCIVTAGGTREYIDLMRYISNESSGKMGNSLADEAAKRGMETVLITTHLVKRSYKTHLVRSAEEMFDAIINEITDDSVVFMAAAVADWRPKQYQHHKIKKEIHQDIWNLSLIKNTDILQTLSLNKKKDQIIVGFCAESENLISNAITKLTNKCCDYLVANDISQVDSGFNSDYNEVYLIDKQKSVTKIDRRLKTEIATILFDKILGTQSVEENNHTLKNDPKHLAPISEQKLKGRTLILGITGSIAAYKIPELVRLYKSHGASVHIFATENALHFVSKLTVQTLSENPVEIDEWDADYRSFQHIHLLEKADIVLIAPATANTIAKIAQGICDNLLTTLCCACFSPQTSMLIKPVIIVPAMNSHMFASPFLKKNLEILKSHGFHIIEPETGPLACGYVGQGRLPNLESLLRCTCSILDLQ